MIIRKLNNKYFIEIENNEQITLDQLSNKKLILKEINKDVFCLVKQNDEKINSESYDVKEKIINLLNDKNISIKDKVEDRFETFLNKKDLEVFKQMVKDKEIIIFKLSDKYKKGIYKINDNLQNESKDVFNDFKEKGYVIFKDLKAATEFSKKYEEQIKSGEIYGVKGFDGYFYVISFSLLKNLKQKIKPEEKSFSLKDLSKKYNLDVDLLKVYVEVLKDNGEVIEKRKNLYSFV